MLLVHTVITLCELIESAFTAFFRSYCSWMTEVRVNMWDSLTRASLLTRCQKAKNASMNRWWNITVALLPKQPITLTILYKTLVCNHGKHSESSKIDSKRKMAWCSSGASSRGNRRCDGRHAFLLVFAALLYSHLHFMHPIYSFWKQKMPEPAQRLKLIMSLMKESLLFILHVDTGLLQM